VHGQGGNEKNPVSKPRSSGVTRSSLAVCARLRRFQSRFWLHRNGVVRMVELMSGAVSPHARPQVNRGSILHQAE